MVDESIVEQTMGSNIQTNKIATQRLDLVATTLVHIECELTNSEALGTLLNAEVSGDWPPGEYDRDAMEYFRERFIEGGSEVVGWYGWYALLRGSARRSLVGAGGYFGPPGDRDEVEIGYSLLPEYRGHGYATELVEALVDRAFAQPGIRRVVAHTTADNRSSVRLLERCGFSFESATADGDMLQFVREQSQS